MFLFFYLHPILIAAAVIPAVFLMRKIYEADKVEKEPAPLLAALAILGIGATLLAKLAERGFGLLLNHWVDSQTTLYSVILYFLIVGFSEEGAKYALLRWRTWREPNFNHQFDGVVYAVCVSLGFALWENIGYVLNYGFSTALVRAVTAVPGHACFGVFMGTWYGIARRLEGSGEEVGSLACCVLAVLMPAILHGCYDFIATLDNQQSGWSFVIFVAAMFAASYLVVRRMANADRHIDGTRF